MPGKEFAASLLVPLPDSKADSPGLADSQKGCTSLSSRFIALCLRTCHQQIIGWQREGASPKKPSVLSPSACCFIRVGKAASDMELLHAARSKQRREAQSVVFILALTLICPTDLARSLTPRLTVFNNAQHMSRLTVKSK